MRAPPLSLLAAIAKLNDLLEQRQLDLARLLMQTLARELTSGGFKSASFTWLEAIFHDQNEDWLVALTKITEAAHLDPCNSGIQRSREVICSRTRSALAGLTDHDQRVPELYQVLLMAGAVESDDHLKMARFHAHHGHPEEALRLLDAIIALNPVSVDALATKALLLGSQSRCTEAMEAAVEASRWGFESVPFVFSGVVRA